MKATDEIE